METVSACATCGVPLADGPGGICPACSSRGLPETLHAGAAGSGGMPTQVGDYELLGEIARGGMGIVYRARQRSVGRVVALKMILTSGPARGDDVRRFKQEAEAAAQLDHPNIIPIHEVGEWDAGGTGPPVPFFSMKLVEGSSLAERLSKGGPLDMRQAARLLATTARAVHHAHQRGILHRDLKPGNILLSADGTPHVADFGLARRVEGDSGLTQSGTIVGTPSYIPPEQARGMGRELTTAADVYGLGAILYECLTGKPPFQAASVMDTLLQVIERDPASPHSIRPDVDRDLETICLKCLQKEPTRRYASADALAEDLERRLRGEPIAARPVTSLQRAVMWARRQPALAAALSVALLAMIAGTAVSVWQTREAIVERDRADEKAREADENAVKAGEASADAGAKALAAEASEKTAIARKKDADDARALAESRLTRSEWHRYAGRLVVAQREWDASNATRALDSLADSRWDFRGWEYHYLRRQYRGSELPLRGHAGGIFAVAFSPDGRTLADGAGDARSGYTGLKLWDTHTGKELADLKAHRGWVLCLAFSPDGKRLASGSGGTTARGDDHPAELKVWDVEQRRVVLDLKGHKGMVHGTAFSPDGLTLAGCDSDGTLLLFDAETGKEKKRIKDTAIGGLHGLAFSPDGKQVATASDDKTIKVWDADTGKKVEIREGHEAAVLSVAFSKGGEFLASNSDDQTIRVWDSKAKTAMHTFRTGQAGSIGTVAFSPDGRLLAGPSSRGTVTIWDVRDGRVIRVLKGHSADVFGLAFSPDGNRLATAGFDQAVKVWEVRAVPEAFALNGPIPREVGPDGRTVLATSPADKHQTLRGLDLETGKELFVLSGPEKGVTVSAWSDDGRHIAGGIDHVVHVWDVKERKQVHVLRGHTGSIGGVCFSHDGKRLVSSGSDGTIRLWNLTTGASERTIKAASRGPLRKVIVGKDQRHIAAVHGESVKVWETASGKEVLSIPGGGSCIALSPDGRHLVVGLNDRTGKVWDLKTGEEVQTLRGHGSGLASVCYSPDGRRIVSSGNDGTVTLWDADTCLELLSLGGMASSATSLGFCGSDSRFLYGVAADGKVHRWDAPVVPETRTLREHYGGVLAVAASTDGKLIATASQDRTVKLWDTKTGQVVMTLRGHGNMVSGIAFSRDGRQLASVSRAENDGKQPGELKLWDVRNGQVDQSFKGHAGGIFGTAVSPDGTRIATASADGTAVLWDVKTGAEMLTLRGHRGAVSAVAFSPDGRLTATAGQDGTVRLWETATGKSVRVLSGPPALSVAFSPDGTRIASGGILVQGRAEKGGLTTMWDAESGELLQTFRGHSLRVTGVAFHRDGKTLASGSWDQTVRVWDTATGQELRRLQEHLREVSCVVFDPAGRVISGSYDSTARVWPTHEP